MKEEPRTYRRLWVKSYVRINPENYKKKYSRVKSHWIKIQLRGK